MIFEDNSSHALKHYEAKLVDALTLIGEVATGKVKEHISQRFRKGDEIGNFQGSTYFVVDKSRKSVFIVTNTIYAAIQDRGGQISPVNVQHLTIPLNKEARRKRAGDFNDLFVITKKDGRKFLARKKGDGVEFMYRLTKGPIKIPATRYLSDSLNYGSIYQEILFAGLK